MKKVDFWSFCFIAIHCLIVNAQTDYSDKANWAVIPGSYPKEYLEYAMIDTNMRDIDVFYVYPTLLLDKRDKRWNVPVDDSTQRKKILEMAVRYQSSAWSSAGNMYVPYYRQAHIRSYYNLENGGKDALLLAYADVKAAFQFYLDHYNNGRGIILAGHSQGGTHISLLLEDFFEGKELQSQLVAAYLPGIGIDKHRYTTLKLMVKADETGGYLTWNTFKRRFDKNQYKWYVGREVINPVTWDQSAYADRKSHKGFLFSNGKLYRQSFNTNMDDGVVWITTPRFPYRFLSFTMRNYHLGDVNLFWEDIRQNAITRSSAYALKKEH